MSVAEADHVNVSVNTPHPTVLLRFAHAVLLATSTELPSLTFKAQFEDRLLQKDLHDLPE